MDKQAILHQYPLAGSSGQMIISVLKRISNNKSNKVELDFRCKIYILTSLLDIKIGLRNIIKLQFLTIKK